MDQERNPVTVSRRTRVEEFTFRIILLIIMAITPLIIGEWCVYYLGYRVPDDPYMYFGRVPSFFTELRIDGKRYYKITHRELYRERNIQFPLEKGQGEFRVFCLGSSASAGWPHPPDETYSSYLQKALQHAFPNRNINVINASAHAYAAYRVRHIFQEIIKFQPDLIILYSGNNEFLERRTYGVRKLWYDPLQSAANRLALYRLIRGSGLGRRFFPQNTLQGEQRDHTIYDQWSKIQQIALDLRKDPQQFQRVVEHYAFSVRSIVQGARQEGVPVLLVTVPVNLRDWQPNVSYRSLRGPERTRWETSYARGRAALLRQDPESAIDRLREAINMDPKHAASYFYLARALEAKGNLNEALKYYSLARDLDYNPFRAVSDFNDILRHIPQGFDNVYLADAEAAFRSASAPYAPGFDLLLDYVHPTRKGNFILAETVFNLILRHNIIGERPSVSRFTDSLISSSSGETGYDEDSDFRMQVTLVVLFGMMHQHESAIRKAKRLLETPGAINSIYDRHVVGGTMDVFPEVIEQERREILGLPVDTDRRERLKTRQLGFYRQIFQGYETFQRDIGVEKSSD